MAFNVPDHHVKIAAVEAGVGLTVMPESMVPPHLIKAKEYYLPPLPPIKVMLCARFDFRTERSSALIKELSALFFPRISGSVAAVKLDAKR